MLIRTTVTNIQVIKFFINVNGHKCPNYTLSYIKHKKMLNVIHHEYLIILHT